MRRLAIALLAVYVGFAGCTPQEEAADVDDGMTEDSVALGPADGRDLPGSDLDRVQAGQPAPDFTLASLAGPPVTLSSFRGMKNVVLVFYRGHW